MGGAERVARRGANVVWKGIAIETTEEGVDVEEGIAEGVGGRQKIIRKLTYSEQAEAWDGTGEPSAGLK